MTYELKNGVVMFDLYRNRPLHLFRCRSRSIVWPGRAVDVPEIPFKPYDATVRRAFRRANPMPEIPFESDPDTVRAVFRRGDPANKSVEDYLDSLDSQRQQHGHQ